MATATAKQPFRLMAKSRMWVFTHAVVLMVCSSCGGTMRCRFSVPAGQRLRYRTYRCDFCGERMETVELPRELVGRADLVADIGKQVDAAKRERSTIAQRVRRKRQSLHTAPQCSPVQPQ